MGCGAWLAMVHSVITSQTQVNTHTYTHTHQSYILRVSELDVIRDYKSSLFHNIIYKDRNRESLVSEILI